MENSTKRRNCMGVGALSPVTPFVAISLRKKKIKGRAMLYIK
jgi:hypothetical protein